LKSNPDGRLGDHPPIVTATAGLWETHSIRLLLMAAEREKTEDKPPGTAEGLSFGGRYPCESSSFAGV
jgi:hypothetical protein